MIILLIFAFISGLVTIFAPCIWPLLPIILSSTATGEKKKPLGITLGIMISFAFFTLAISYIVRIIPFDPNILRLFAVVVIGFLGVALIIPSLSQILEGYVSRLSGKLGGRVNKKRSGFKGGFITGLALGLVWSPCAGPILATIATLAATRTVNIEIILVTVFYVIGVGIPLFLFATAGSYLFTRSKKVSKYTGQIQQVFGAIMILTAIAIYTNYDKVLQVKLLDAFPSYSNFINKLESNQMVKDQLDTLRRNEKNDMNKVKEIMPNIIVPGKTSSLRNLGPASEFVGITKWLNVNEPLTLSELTGKVVLVDFWTYTCINCIRTLPHITGWYEKYKDKGFVVVGVHTPEFEFEKKTANVEGAMSQYKITYPVAQDNDYTTWRAYDNHYWPAKYLIDKDGNIRYYHFGEGAYEETEANIQALLAEAGSDVEEEVTKVNDQTPRGIQTPELYLGSLRMDNFVSNELSREGNQIYTLPPSIPLHYWAYEGEWNIQEEYSQSVDNSTLELHFFGKKVFLVVTPPPDDRKIEVMLDGEPIAREHAGTDVGENSVVRLDKDRLYHLVDLQKKESHTLRLKFSANIKIFAFTFE